MLTSCVCVNKLFPPHDAWDTQEDRQEMAVGISSRKRGSFLLMYNLENTTDAVDCVAQDVDGQEALAAVIAEVGDGMDGTAVVVAMMEFVVVVTTTGELWTETCDDAVVVSSGAGVIDLISSSAVRGFILTIGAAIGDSRSKSYSDRSMSPKISSVVLEDTVVEDVDDDVGEHEAEGHVSGELLRKGAAAAAADSTDVTSSSDEAVTTVISAAAGGRSSCNRIDEDTTGVGADCVSGLSMSVMMIESLLISSSSPPELLKLILSVQLLEEASR